MSSHNAITIPSDVDPDDQNSTWEKYIKADQVFQSLPYPTKLGDKKSKEPPEPDITASQHDGSDAAAPTATVPDVESSTTDARNFVTVAMISDTHGKHAGFRYEVPVDTVSEETNILLKTMNSVLENQKTDASVTPDQPPVHRQGIIYPNRVFEIKPVMLLSGNKKSVVVGPGKNVSKVIKNGAEKTDENAVPEEINDIVDNSLIIPYADILIHCGDFTMKGGENEIDSFCQFMAQLPHKYKIVIAGNHDFCLDEAYMSRPDIIERWKLKSVPKDLGSRVKKTRFTKEYCGVTYLQEESCVLEFVFDGSISTLKVYGSPVQPEKRDWAFNRKRGEEIRAHWRKIPEDTDILITHGPPLGRGDLLLEYNREDGKYSSKEEKRDITDTDTNSNNSTNSPFHAGCLDLLQEVQSRVKPLLHTFGHIHGDTTSDSFDGRTVFVNAAMCDRHNLLRKDGVVKTICLSVSGCDANG